MAGAIGAIAFFSQSAYFRHAAQNLVSPLLKKGDAYYNNLPLVKEGDQLTANLYSQISGGVKGGEEAVQNGVAAQTNAITNGVNDIKNNSVNEFKKSLAEKLLQALGIQPKDLIDPKNLQCSK